MNHLTKPIRRALLAGSLALCGGASAHVVLDQPVALAGTSYRATLRVGHGCEGAPTTALRVRLPEGLRGARPMPKPGWTLATRTEKLARPYTSHGRQISEDVVEVTWTARTPEDALADGHYDEFVIRATLPEDAAPLWFRVLQTCTRGQHDWSEVPASGTATRGLKAPAALLELLPNRPGGHAHH